MTAARLPLPEKKTADASPELATPPNEAKDA